ncbi:MAG: DsbA family oxidoreductase [Gammaproteobacteria bacterium]
MRIDIISDAVCPWCLIGKRNLEAALNQCPDLTVEIRWHPFQLNPDMPRAGMDRKMYIENKFGGPANARKIYERVSAAGKAAGVDFNFDAIPRTPNTVNAHRLIHWAEGAGLQDKMVEILFRKYFQDGLDIGAHAVLLDAAVEAGMDAEDIATRLAGDDDEDYVRNADVSARQLGVSGVPFFIFDRRYAISGAQPPATFIEVFERLARSEAEHPEP